MPFNLDDEQRSKIWDNTHNATYATEAESGGTLADHSKITMLDPGIAPNGNTYTSSVDVKSLVRSTT